VLAKLKLLNCGLWLFTGALNACDGGFHIAEEADNGFVNACELGCLEFKSFSSIYSEYVMGFIEVNHEEKIERISFECSVLDLFLTLNSHQSKSQ
jgi:hypothetical protein